MWFENIKNQIDSNKLAALQGWKLKSTYQEAGEMIDWLVHMKFAILSKRMQNVIINLDENVA